MFRETVHESQHFVAQTVSLTEADTAKCWDNVSSGDTVFDDRVGGTFTWDCTAEIVDGTFALDPNAP